MNQYALSFKQFLAEHECDSERFDFYSLNELFGVYYRAHNPLDIDRLKSECPDLDSIVQSLSQRKGRKLQRLILKICDERGQAAFLDGLRMGAKLLMELLDESD